MGPCRAHRSKSHLYKIMAGAGSIKDNVEHYYVTCFKNDEKYIAVKKICEGIAVDDGQAIVFCKVSILWFF